MRYECLGFSNLAEDSLDYLVEMEVFRSCGQTPFDAPAYIFIYNKTTATSYDLLDDIPIRTNPEGIENIELLNNDCITYTLNPCIEKALYRFNIRLKKTDTDYVIIYQRCCHSAVLTNIINPHLTGFTLSTEITALAQQLCNSSPSFPYIPPNIICAGQSLEINFEVSDVDNNELIYELCSPLKGGGPEGAVTIGNSIGCNGIIPFPACPPPHEGIDFISPEYNFQHPFGLSSPTQFIANGILEITPMLSGRFAFGICVSEYQNGELIGHLRMDFETIVTHCDIEIQASLENEGKNNGYAIINACGDLEVELNNTSTNPENVESFFWLFQNKHSLDTLYDWNPTIELPDYGIYEGLLVLNAANCSDSAAFIIDSSPEVVADFDCTTQLLGDGTYDIELQNQSKNAVYWNWLINGESFSVEKNLRIQNLPTNEQTISLIAENVSACKDTLEKNIRLEAPISFFLPNAFTPNNDGINDGFMGTGITNNIQEFQLNVWNRWGEVVFSTHNPHIAWNGLYKNVGKPCLNGIYTWHLFYKSRESETTEKKGFITLIR